MILVLGLAGKLGSHSLACLNNSVLVVDLQDAGVLADGLCPLVEVGSLFLEAGGEIGWQEAVLGGG